jgi:hypothetical protein
MCLTSDWISITAPRLSFFTLFTPRSLACSHHMGLASLDRNAILLTLRPVALQSALTAGSGRQNLAPRDRARRATERGVIPKKKFSPCGGVRRYINHRSAAQSLILCIPHVPLACSHHMGLSSLIAMRSF